MILELKNDCLADNVSVTSLLRKAHVIAKALNEQKFETFIRKELEGYDPEDVLPEYRQKIPSELKAKNPYRSGLIPVHDKSALAYEMNFWIPIAEIESYVVRDKNKPGELVTPVPYDIAIAMQQSNGTSFEIFRIVQVVKLTKILEAVRNILLDWTIDLLKKNVEISAPFCETPRKEGASQVTQITNHIVGSTFTGNNIGHFQDTSINQSLKSCDLSSSNSGENSRNSINVHAPHTDPSKIESQKKKNIAVFLSSFLHWLKSFTCKIIKGTMRLVVEVVYIKIFGGITKLFLN